jgi:hypothetical protein
MKALRSSARGVKLGLSTRPQQRIARATHTTKAAATAMATVLGKGSAKPELTDNILFITTWSCPYAQVGVQLSDAMNRTSKYNSYVDGATYRQQQHVWRAWSGSLSMRCSRVHLSSGCIVHPVGIYRSYLVERHTQKQQPAPGFDHLVEPSVPRRSAPGSRSTRQACLATRYS